MKLRESLIRLKRFQIDEKRRQLAQIDTMIAEFERMALELEREIRAEEARSGIHDTSHFAYPTYARAAMTRRDNLRNSVRDLATKRETATLELAEAEDDLKMIELLDDRERTQAEPDDAATDQGRTVVPPLAGGRLQTII